MGRPRKNSVQPVTENNTSKVNITEEDKIVKFVTGTQKQYNNRKQTKKTTSAAKVNIEEKEVRYSMGKPTTVSKTPRITHVVQRGESIQSIAGLYSVPVMKLIKLNGSQVSVGQKIFID